jgi:hypothetical protein
MRPVPVILASAAIMLAGCSREEEPVANRFERAKAEIENKAQALEGQVENEVSALENRLDSEADAFLNAAAGNEAAASLASNEVEPPAPR